LAGIFSTKAKVIKLTETKESNMNKDLITICVSIIIVFYKSKGDKIDRNKGI